ncbi:MAG: cupin domain-containing protein, partial [Chloroflexi bacterium]|nr:cupin domain-containing protein [Chloroflexota bacterium]
MQSLKPDYAQAKAANADNFRGEAAVHTLAAGHDDGLEVLAVWFKNGSRNLPHIHPSEQLLVVVEGKCVVGTRDGQTVLDAGQSVLIPKDEWHWHGAATTQTC